LGAMAELVPVPPKAPRGEEGAGRKRLARGVRRASAVLATRRASSAGPGSDGPAGGLGQSMPGIQEGTAKSPASVVSMKSSGRNTLATNQPRTSVTMDFPPNSAVESAQKRTSTVDFAGLPDGLRIPRRAVYSDARLLLAQDQVEKPSPVQLMRSVCRSMRHQRIKVEFVDCLTEAVQATMEKEQSASSSEANVEAHPSPKAWESVPAPDIDAIEEELRSTLDALFESKSSDAYESMREIGVNIKRCVTLLGGMKEALLQNLRLCAETEEAIWHVKGRASLVARFNADVERMQKALQTQAEESLRELPPELPQQGRFKRVSRAYEILSDPEKQRWRRELPEHCLHALGVLEQLKQEVEQLGLEGEGNEGGQGHDKVVAELHEATYGWVRKYVSGVCSHHDISRLSSLPHSGHATGPVWEGCEHEMPEVARTPSTASSTEGLSRDLKLQTVVKMLSLGSTADPSQDGHNDVPEAIDFVFEADLRRDIHPSWASDVESVRGEEHSREDSDEDDAEEEGVCPTRSGRCSAPPTMSGQAHRPGSSNGAYRVRAWTEEEGQPSAEGPEVSRPSRLSVPNVCVLGRSIKLPKLKIEKPLPAPQPLPSKKIFRGRMEDLSADTMELIESLLNEDNDDTFDELSPPGHGRSRRRRTPQSSPLPQPPDHGAQGGRKQLRPPGGCRKQMKALRWQPGRTGATPLTQAQLSPVSPVQCGATVVSLVTSRSPHPRLAHLEEPWASPREILFCPRSPRSPQPSAPSPRRRSQRQSN